MYRPPTGLLTIADRLKNPMFSSKAVVQIDSIVISSLFGKREKKTERRSHYMQTLSGECVVGEETREKIYSTFEQGKEKLDFDDPLAYFEATKQMASSLYRSCSLLKIHGAESKNVIEWCIAAYSMVINPASSVKLSCMKMGPLDTLGFAVHAVAAIQKEQVIRELVGLMPKDNKAIHSGLSCITPSSYHNQSTRVVRILFGPIRFICMMPNVEFIAMPNSSGFYVGATRDIAPGGELLIAYGKGWFENEPGGCPCATCKPPQQEQKKDPGDEASVEAEIRERRKAKRKRTKERKKAMWSKKESQMVAGGT